MDIGVVGLGVMGENLILNMLDKKYTVSVYNRTTEKTHRFVSSIREKNIKACETLKELVETLKSPRKILLMVKAGPAIDSLLKDLVPLLTPEDVVIDGGNSNYRDTTRRYKEMSQKLCFIGCGISGGEEGARNGPSMMPGGCKNGWNTVKELLQKISARSPEGLPCCEWIGQEGSGHLVKTVHNGIEYAEMQIIADFYQLLRETHSCKQISEIIGKWKISGTTGYLLDAAQIVLEKKHREMPILDQIVDIGEQKGTGIWTVEESLFFKAPVPSIAAAVSARVFSEKKQTRTRLSDTLPSGGIEKKPFTFSLEEMRKAFLLCRALSYIQGFNLIKKVSDKNNWGISLPELCRVWSNGCIIRSEFLKTLEHVCAHGEMVESNEFMAVAENGIFALRSIVAYSAGAGISVPCISTSLQYYDTIRTGKSSANMIQGLRDVFGAHTLLLDGEIEKRHVNWKT